MRRLGGVLLVVASLGVVVLVAQSGGSGGSRGTSKPFTTWRAYAGGAHSSQYSALDQINKSNVSQLDVAWTYPVNGNIIFNPIVVDGVMYLQGTGNAIVALDAATGKEIWQHANQGAIGARGFNYWESPDRKDRRILYLNAGHLTAINAADGQTITSFGDNGRVDLRVALYRQAANPLQTSNPGRIFENLMIVSLPAQGAQYDATPADVQAYDVRTGKIVWVFHSIPHAGEFGYDTWPAGHYKVGGGGHNWSEFTVDEENGIAFIPFGTGRFDFYGGDRKGDNLFANSLVALDARTGRRLWHFQTIHHDLWDYDLPQAPKLLTIRQNGRNVDIVAQASKQGFLYVFERRTGRPIWPIEERPVPKSDVPGEWASPTQPFPTRPAPFARQSFTEKDINPYLPAAEREAIVQRFRTLRNEGLFTPPSFEGSIQLPGHNGGANFGGSAVDPTRGEMYVVSKSLPTVLRIALPDQGGRGGGTLGGGAAGPIVTPEQKAKLMAEAKALVAKGPGPVRFASPYEFMNTTSLSMAAIGPPWSEITAYDLNTGDIKWQVPAGQVNAPPELGIPPNTGSHFPRSGPLVTAGGLLFLATGSDRRLRAYDRETGKEVWSRELPATSEGMPATYEVGGRQYIVVPVAAGTGQFAARFGGPGPSGGAAPPSEAQGRAGGRGGPPPLAGQYMVFALPKR